MAIVTIRSKQSFSSFANQTIATVNAFDCVVFIGLPIDATAIGTPQVGGVNMTAVSPQHPVIFGSGDGGGYEAHIFYLVASGAAVGSSITFTQPYTGPGSNFLGAIYVLSNVDTVSVRTDSGGGESTNASSAGPFTLTTNAGDMILSGIGSGLSPNDQDFMTNDYSGGIFANIYSKANVSAGSDGPNWDFGGLSCGYAFNSIVIKAGSPPTGTGNFFSLF
jgi:hypothetical protein